MELPPGIPQGILQILNGDHQGSLEPILMVKDHPTIAAIEQGYDQRSQFFKKQFDDLREQVDKAKAEMWQEIESYIREIGKWPPGIALDSKEACFRLGDGVLYFHRHE